MLINILIKNHLKSENLNFNNCTSIDVNKIK